MVISNRFEQTEEHALRCGPGIPADFGVLLRVPNSHLGAVDWIRSDIHHMSPGFGMSSFSNQLAGNNSEAGFFKGLSNSSVSVCLARLLRAAGKGQFGLAVMPPR